MLASAVLVAVGLAVGAFGTLVGAGGGFLLVPLFVLVYQFTPPDAVGTSLTLVFLNALSGTVAYLRQRRVDLSLGWKFAAATVPGAIVGAYLTRALSSYLFSLAFGLALIAIGALLLVGKTAGPSRRARVRSIVDATGESYLYQVDVWKGVVVSFLVGAFSSMFGIGGGIIHVPFLIMVLGLPVHIATATSHFVLSLSAFVGATTFLGLGHVRIATAALMGAGILLGAQVGARASLRASPLLIRQVLSGLLALVGLRMIAHAVQLAPWMSR